MGRLFYSYRGKGLRTGQFMLNTVKVFGVSQQILATPVLDLDLCAVGMRLGLSRDGLFVVSGVCGGVGGCLGGNRCRERGGGG